MIKVTIAGRFEEQAQRAALRLEVAATRAVGAASTELQAELRHETAAALGPRVANAWRRRVYPERDTSIEPAALVWSKASRIVDGFDRGAPIRARRGRFLAIPTDAAPRYVGVGRTRKKVTPALLEEAGWDLDIEPIGDGRWGIFAKRRGARTTTARRRKPGRVLREAELVFVLVPMVRLPKRLNVDHHAQAAGQRLAQALEAELDRGRDA